MKKSSTQSERIEMTRIRSKKKPDGSFEYQIGDKTYNSFEELPEQYQKLLEDKNKDGIPDRFQDGKSTVQSKYVIDGKEYHSLEEIPEKYRLIVKKMRVERRPWKDTVSLSKNNRVTMENQRASLCEEEPIHPVGFLASLRNRFKKR